MKLNSDVVFNVQLALLKGTWVYIYIDLPLQEMVHLYEYPVCVCVCEEIILKTTAQKSLRKQL